MTVAGDPALDVFAARARPLGTHVTVVPDVAGARGAVLEVVQAASVRATADASALLAVTEIGETDDVSLVEVGVAVAWAGIVETGSVVIAPRSRRERMLHVLAPTQVVVVPADRMHATLGDAVKAIDTALHAETPPAYMSVVTGPSRTADIERVITIGAHGPRELHIVVVRAWRDD